MKNEESFIILLDFCYGFMWFACTFITTKCVCKYNSDATGTPKCARYGQPVSNITIIGGCGGNGGSQTGQGLFNGAQEDEWSTNNVFYWSSGSDYLELDIPKNCNIWRSGTSSWPSDYGQLKILKWNGLGYDDVTNSYGLSTTNINNTKWEEFIQNLPAGRYKFVYSAGARIDSEWYVEDATTSSQFATVPTNLSANESNNTATVTWDPVSNATGYDLEVDGNMVLNVTSPYVKTNLIINSEHTFRVRTKCSKYK